MLSILIPTYNYNIFPLVESLHLQATKCQIPFEIITLDDGSKSDLNRFNQNINNLKHCIFSENQVNVGRSGIRMQLASKANYNNLFFIDGDSLLISDEFIKNYLGALKPEIDVIYGGRIHPRHTDAVSKLRWKYGLLREDRTANQRRKDLYKSVLFNNTVIKKSVFNRTGFEKTLTQYGHEDTLLAYKLSLIKANVLHIDNPVIHGDIDTTDVFLDKTLKALNNLSKLYNNKQIPANFVTLLRYYNTLKAYQFHYVLSKIYTVFKTSMLKNLKSHRPSLFIFDLYKLSYFCHINLKS